MAQVDFSVTIGCVLGCGWDELREIVYGESLAMLIEREHEENGE